MEVVTRPVNWLASFYSLQLNARTTYAQLLPWRPSEHPSNSIAIVFVSFVTLLLDDRLKGLPCAQLSGMNFERMQRKQTPIESKHARDRQYGHSLTISWLHRPPKIRKLKRLWKTITRDRFQSLQPPVTKATKQSQSVLLDELAYSIW